jgi:LysR family transcriptional regulator, nod-box dependent transcriptional activator
MRLHELDLNLLVALDALLTERNITEAGKRVTLTQSAMSGALARLREYFGDELLVPVGRKMVLTPLAASLAEPVSDILLKVKATIGTKPTFDPATSKRRFSLMMSDYVSTVLMPEVLARAEQAAPHVEFEIISNDINAPGEILERADIDFLIMPQRYLSRNHPSEVLFQDSYTCIVWTGNPLVGTHMTPDEYLSLGHVNSQFDRGRTQAIDELFFSRAGVRRRIEVVAMNFNAIPQCIAGTRRIATLQRSLAVVYATYLPLRLIPPPFELPPLIETVQWHTCFDKDPGSIWLRRILKEAADRAVQTLAQRV